MSVIELLAKLTDRARTLAGRGVEVSHAPVKVITPEGYVFGVREVHPEADGLVIFVEP